MTQQTFLLTVHINDMYASRKITFNSREAFEASVDRAMDELRQEVLAQLEKLRR